MASGALSLSCSEGASDFPAVEGWTQTGESLTYDVENLWEYINGAAELFVEYGVQTVRTADLDADGVAVTVDLYDMGTPLHAYGVFERERPSGGEIFPNATAVVISPPYQALLLKGAVYGKVNVFEGELTEPLGRDLLQALAASIPGPTTPPQELELLPSEGRVAGTEGYKPEAFLGQTELSECLYADYVDPTGETWEGFLVLPGVSSSVWDALEAAWSSLEAGGNTILYSEIPYTGLVGVMSAENGLIGVSGAVDEAQLRERLEWLGS
jgi:hypothetical protein